MHVKFLITFSNLFPFTCFVLVALAPGSSYEMPKNSQWSCLPLCWILWATLFHFYTTDDVNIFDDHSKFKAEKATWDSILILWSNFKHNLCIQKFLIIINIFYHLECFVLVIIAKPYENHGDNIKSYFDHDLLRVFITLKPWKNHCDGDIFEHSFRLCSNVSPSQ